MCDYLNNYHVRIAKLIRFELGAPPHVQIDANVIVIEPQRCENTDFAVK